jgi:hypothetical protein
MRAPAIQKPSHQFQGVYRSYGEILEKVPEPLYNLCYNTLKNLQNPTVKPVAAHLYRHPYAIMVALVSALLAFEGDVKKGGSNVEEEDAVAAYHNTMRVIRIMAEFQEITDILETYNNKHGENRFTIFQIRPSLDNNYYMDLYTLN